MTPEEFLARKKQIVGPIRWVKKPNRHEVGWLSFRVGVIDIVDGAVVPFASVRGNFRPSIDGMPEKLALSVILANRRVGGIDFGAAPHIERVPRPDGSGFDRVDVGPTHGHSWANGREVAYPLATEFHSREASWQHMLERCNIEQTALPDPTAGMPGQLGLSL